MTTRLLTKRRKKEPSGWLAWGFDDVFNFRLSNRADSVHLKATKITGVKVGVGHRRMTHWPFTQLEKKCIGK